jgi:hypothetical protein
VSRTFGFYELGEETEFEVAFAELQERWAESWPSDIAMVYAWMGNNDEAFQWLEKEIEVNGLYGWSQIPHEPQFLNLQNDARWQALLTRVGVSAKQLALIDFKVNMQD